MVGMGAHKVAFCRETVVLWGGGGAGNVDDVADVVVTLVVARIYNFDKRLARERSCHRLV